EADVYRYFHQNGGFPGSALGYRTKEEEQAWRQRDPLDMLGNQMIARTLISAEEITELRQRMQASMKKAVAALTEADPDGKPGKKRICPELWPKADFRDVGVRGDLSELAGARTEEQASFQ